MVTLVIIALAGIAVVAILNAGWFRAGNPTAISPLAPDPNEELTKAIKAEFKTLREDNAEFRNRLQNLEAIVTSAVWDERTHGLNTPEGLNDEQQAAWLARQINNQRA